MKVARLVGAPRVGALSGAARARPEKVGAPHDMARLLTSVEDEGGAARAPTIPGRSSGEHSRQQAAETAV